MKYATVILALLLVALAGNPSEAAPAGRKHAANPKRSSAKLNRSITFGLKEEDTPWVDATQSLRKKAGVEIQVDSEVLSEDSKTEPRVVLKRKVGRVRDFIHDVAIQNEPPCGYFVLPDGMVLISSTQKVQEWLADLLVLDPPNSPFRQRSD